MLQKIAEQNVDQKLLLFFCRILPKFCSTAGKQAFCRFFCEHYPLRPIDDTLTFGDQVDHIRADIARKLTAFRRGRNSLDSNSRRAFYLSVIQSKLEYASNAYVHSLRQTEYDTLMSVSRRALRVVFGFPFRADVNTILRAHKITYLADRLNFKLHIFTYRCVHNLGSSLLSSIFNTRSNHSHTTSCTRSQTTLGLALPPVISRYGYHSLSFLAADRFNSLPAAVRNAESLRQFSANCLSHILGYPVKRQ